MSRILVPYGEVTRIAKRIGCADSTVRLALRFATYGEQPDRIRELAVKEHGGVRQGIIKAPKQ